MDPKNGQISHLHQSSLADLSPRAFAESVGLSESSIRRWVDSGVIGATRTAGGHRRIPIAEALRLIRDRRLRVCRPDLLNLDAEGLKSGDARSPDLVTDRLHDLFLDGRAVQACELVAALFVSGWSAAQICDGPLREVMRRIGELWHNDEKGIFAEHRATETCVRVINHLYGLVDSSVERPVAIGGALEGDPFQIPSLMAALVLAAEGYQSINAGANTPLAALRVAIDQLQPELVWISLNVSSLPRSTAREAGVFAADLAQRGTSVVFGGRGVLQCLDDLPSDVQIASSMSELAAFARGLRVATSRTRPDTTNAISSDAIDNGLG